MMFLKILFMKQYNALNQNIVFNTQKEQMYLETLISGIVVTIQMSQTNQAKQSKSAFPISYRI